MGPKQIGGSVMSRLTTAALIGVFALSGTMAGQDTASQAEQTTLEERLQRAQADQRLRAEELTLSPPFKAADVQRKRAAGLAGQNECALPDGTTHAVNQTVTFSGSRYQCVEVLDATLSRSGVGWTRLRD